MRTCPTCGRPAGERPENKAAPFCCERCKLIDLGAWLAEDYRVADDRDDESENLPSRDAEQDPDAAAPRRLVH